MGPGVKSRTAAATASTGLESALSALAVAWLSDEARRAREHAGECEHPRRYVVSALPRWCGTTGPAW